MYLVTRGQLSVVDYSTSTVPGTVLVLFFGTGMSFGRASRRRGSKDWLR
jgi:hypothetical protein